MRNIFCHEQFFDFRDLREFAIYAKSFFGNLGNIQRVVSCYESKCTSALQSKYRIDNYQILVLIYY